MRPFLLPLLLALSPFAACSNDKMVAADANVGGDGLTIADAPGKPGRLLYIGPHPDDEYYLAPILVRTCLDLGWYCTFVVATKGEGGSCNLPDGCSPDLATVRTAEMKASAALFSAELIHWDLGDDGKYQPYEGDVGQVLTQWGAKVGGVDALVTQIVTLFEQHAPDVVYTMDPRHGNYCHPSHRAIGALVVQAALRLGDAAPDVRLLEGRFQSWNNAPGFMPVVATDPTLRSFDATTWSTSTNGESWAHILQVIDAHPSQFQFTSEQRRAFLGTRDELKRIYWAPLSGVIPNDPLYAGLCPPSNF